MSGTIFINYRRDDDPGFTLAIYQRLEAEFGTDKVKMDVEGGIRGGENYVEKLLMLIDQSDVVLSIIGREWHTLLDKTDYDPPDATQDWVRIELNAAFERKKRIIPVVVGKADIPYRESLPADLKDFAHLQVVSVTNERFKSDVQRLVDEVQYALQSAEDERRTAREAEKRAAKTAPAEPTAQPAQQEPEKPWGPQIAGILGTWLLILSAVLLMQSVLPPSSPATEQQISEPDTAFLMSTTLLAAATLLPGVILFYGGLSASRNVQEMARQLMWVMTVTGVIWLSYGHSLSYTNGGDLNAYIGGLSEILRAGASPSGSLTGVSDSVFVFNTMLYALLGASFISGAVVGRIKLSGLMLFAALWITFVYIPVTHWLWGGGFLMDKGVFDFSGGLSISTTVGISGLVALLFLGRATDMRPTFIGSAYLTVPLLGSSFIMLGWLALIASSYLSADVKAVASVYSAIIVIVTAALAWFLSERVTKREVSPLGFVWGATAGLAAALPASGFIGPIGAALLGVVSGLTCFVFAPLIQNRISHDQRLNALSNFAVGGAIGLIGVGIFAAKTFGGTGLDAGYSEQILKQIYGYMITALWSGVVSLMILKLLNMTVGLLPPAPAK